MLFNRFWHLAHFRNEQRHVARLYSIFSRSHECFWHFAHFRNAQRHVAQLYIFFVFMSVFGILIIFEMHRGIWCNQYFSYFHARPQKSYQSKFQKCCPTKIRKKQAKKKFPFQQLQKISLQQKTCLKKLKLHFIFFLLVSRFISTMADKLS